MGRSLKKGPFVADHLLEKIVAGLMKTIEKKSSKLGRGLQQSYRKW